ncbi:hypothetical protein LLG95_08760 [bacterium]|nr:hypothetical protein [bacterium]
MGEKTRIIIRSALIIGIILIALVLYRRRPSASAEGIYLANGGVDCLILANENGRLTVRQISIKEPWANFNFDKSKMTVVQTDNQLWLQSRESADPGLWARIKGNWIGELWDDNDCVVLFNASRVAGDWDLADIGPKKQVRALAPAEFAVSVPQYLHRVDDPRIVEFFDLLYYQNKPREALALGDSIAAAHLGDDCIEIMLLNAALASGDTARFVRDAEKHKDLVQSKNKRVAFATTLALQQSFGFQMTAANRNASSLAEQLLDPSTDLTHFVQLYPKFLDCDAWVRPLKELKVPPIGMSGLIEIQTRARIAIQYATLLLLQGKTDDALRLALSVFRQGKLLQQSFSDIDKIIGSAICMIASRFLVEFALNACDSEADFMHFREAFDNTSTAHDFGLQMEVAGTPNEINRNRDSSNPGDHVAIMRTIIEHDLLDERFARIAASAGYHRLKTGGLPRQSDDFKLWPGGLAEDIYTSGSKLRILSNKQDLLIYSIGPDRIDQKAAIEYDPTNGTLSSGDLVLKIPHERERVYPKGGLHAATAADVRRQFPHGLPVDLFATTKRKQLSISSGSPVYIYSFGPDMDEPEIKTIDDDSNVIDLDSDDEKTAKKHVPMNDADGFPEVMYDPTNGSFSSGDLWIEIPAPDGK